MKRRTWLPRAAGVAWSTLALFTASSCYRAEIDLSALMDDMMQAGTAPGSAGVTGSMSGTQGIAGSASGGGGDVGGDAPGAGGTGAAGAPSAAGEGGAGGAAEPICIDEPRDPVQQDCFQFRPPEREECPNQAPDGWSGCWYGNCLVCPELIGEYPYYLDWNSCCQANPTCDSNSRKAFPCDSRCPAPTERDKHPPCSQRGLE